MSTYYIPGSNIKASILEPSTPTGHAHLYLASGDTQKGRVLGSVNAGTSNPGKVFAVGLGGINGGFKIALKDAGQNTKGYQPMHNDLYQATRQGFGATGQYQDSSYPALFSCIMKPDPNFNLFEYDGIVFVDVFTKLTYPNQNDNNYAMIYVMPPNFSHYNTQQDFLDAVVKTNITLIKCVTDYNQYITQGHPGTNGLQAINTIRMCLFSGGWYRGSATVDEVAIANLKGLERGIQNNPTASQSIECIEFENSYSADAGHGAFTEIKSQLATKPSS
jgi:hypothetical protein